MTGGFPFAPGLLVPLGLLMGLTVLAGCEGEKLAAACTRRTIADLAVVVDHQILVPASINDDVFPISIDTGSERSLLTTAAVKRLRITKEETSQTKINGVGGFVTNHDVYATLHVGGAVYARAFARADVPGINGLVGGDMLGQYDVEFDLPERRFRLWDPNCGTNEPEWTGPRSTLAANITNSGRVLVTVTIEGKPALALLDSGAQGTLVRSDVAASLGVTKDVLALDSQLELHGADGRVVQVRRHRFSSLSVGAEQFPGAVLGVADAAISGPQVLLGIDYFLRHRVWLSYRTRTVFVQALPGG